VVEPRLAAADVVMGCSDHITNLVRERFAATPLRYVTVGNGIDPETMRPPSERRAASKRLLFVGRVSPEKGVHTLIDAMTDIVRRFPDVRLDVLGGRSQLPRGYLVELSDDPHVSALARFYSGDDRDAYARSLDAMVHDAGLADHVRFHAAVPYAQLNTFYGNADIVVNPSLSESFGRSLIEAMAFGRPVVVTRTGGMTEIVEDKREGFVVAPDDPSALAAAIGKLLSDPELAYRMGNAGRETVVARYNWDEIAARAMAVYTETLADA
jgi:glycosyltransferase involved in cell wall biosynthesis